MTIILTNLNKFKKNSLPCNLSLTAAFADINVAQSSVATYARCGGIFNVHLTTNLPRNLPVFFINQLRFDRIMVMTVAPHFWPSLYVVYNKRICWKNEHAQTAVLSNS